VSTTLALWETRSAALADGFFASRFFREAVAERTALAPAFGAYLAAARLATPQFPDVVRLETLLARCRRAAATGGKPRPGVGLAPSVASARFDAGVLETVRIVEAFLFEIGLMPQLAFCSDGPQLPALPPVGRGTMCLLVTPSPGGVGIAEIDEDLHRVLAALETPRTDSAPALAAAGVPAARAPALVASLIEEGLLIRGDS